MNRLAQDTKIINHVTFADRTATTAIKGAGVHRERYQAVLAIVASGTLGANTTCDVKLQHSDVDSDGSYADIPGAAIVQLVAADDDKAVALDVRLSKKFVRAVLTPGGTVANGVLSGVILVLYDPETQPVVNTPPAVVV